MEPDQDRRRGHFHRGRRGHDRRGPDRRAPSQAQASQSHDQIDVEQIMREIRARIAERQGVDLSHQQIDELAARRLEYILDPRAMKPEFLDTLRRRVDDVLAGEEKKLPPEPVYAFEDTTLYDSHRPILRFIRKLLNPLLKLLFNPNPLIRALHLQARLNVEAAERDGARDRRQAEWNALHYTIVQRLVTEMSRLSLEVQALSTRVESLAGRVDFADRRVRGVEGALHELRPSPRAAETAPQPRPDAGATAETGAEPALPDSARRRRRRRRGRRGGGTMAEAVQPAAVSLLAAEQEPHDEGTAAAAEFDEATATADQAPPGRAEDEMPAAAAEAAPAPAAADEQAAVPSLPSDHPDSERLD